MLFKKRGQTYGKNQQKMLFLKVIFRLKKIANLADSFARFGIC